MRGAFVLWGIAAGCGAAKHGGDAGVDAGAAGDAGAVDAGAPECDALEPEVCYDGPADTLGVGQCRGGMRSCVEGRWTECDGQVLPELEICDEQDNSCDGTVDEGVTNECGTCGKCRLVYCVGRDCGQPFEAALGTDVADCADEPDGDCLTLAEGASTGVYAYVFMPCRGLGPRNAWVSVDFEATLPEGASLTFEGRRARDLASLAKEPWTAIGIAPPGTSPLDVPEALEGGGLDLYEVRVTLDAPGEPPLLWWMGIDYYC